MASDTVFECEFALAMVRAGYDVLSESLLDNIRYILTSAEHKSDPRISRLTKEYENAIRLFGYVSYIDYMDEDEIFDLCKKIYFYEKNGIGKKDCIYMKTLQRALVIQKNVRVMDHNIYNKFIKYHKNFEYINRWINKQSVQ